MVGPFSVCESTRPSAAKWIDRKLMRIETNVNQAKPGCTESTLRVVRKMLQKSAPMKLEKQDKSRESRATVRASGLKLHISSSATLGRVFWPNADLGTFTKFRVRGNSRTFNQLVPKLCWAKCTHFNHRCPHPIRTKLW